MPPRLAEDLAAVILGLIFHLFGELCHVPLHPGGELSAQWPNHLSQEHYRHYEGSQKRYSEDSSENASSWTFVEPQCIHIGIEEHAANHVDHQEGYPSDGLTSGEALGVVGFRSFGVYHDLSVLIYFLKWVVLELRLANSSVKKFPGVAQSTGEARREGAATILFAELAD